MDAYEIICSDEYYSDVVAGPYLSLEEAVKDLHSVAEMHEKIYDRPAKNA